MQIGLALGICSPFGPAGGEFDPADLPGLVVWCESDQLVQSGTVSSWTNLADGANPLINSVNASFQPNYNATDAEFNSEPSVAFSQGTPHWLHTTNNIALGAFTVVLVGKITTSDGNIHHQTDGTNSNLCRSDGSTLSVVRNPLGSSKQAGATWAATAGPMTMVHRYNGTHASHTLRINGSTQSLADGTTDDPGTSTVTAKIGLMAAASSAAPTSGEIVAFLVCDESLSDANVLALESYLLDKYAHY